MKILVVVSEFPKMTETFVYRNIAEYRRRGHEAVVFYAKRFFPNEVVHEFARETVQSAFTYGFAAPRSIAALAREAATHPGAMFSLATEILSAHRTEPGRGARTFAVVPKSVALGHWCAANGVDHIHAEFAGFPATVAMIASRVSGVPFSFSAHANDIFVSEALLVEKAREARFVRTISEYNIDYLSKIAGFPTDKLRLLRCGVDRSLLSDDPPAAPGDGPLNILYVGSFAEKKGVGHLIDALETLKGRVPFRCRIVGGGELELPLKAAVASKNLGDVVTFDGPNDADGVREAYRWSHVVVIPSIVGRGGRIEGIPVVAMEALAHARPTVASRLSGIPELIEDGVTGWLTPPGDHAAIAAALTDIHTDWGTASAIGLRGRERIRAEYLVEDNAAGLLDAMTETNTQ